MCVDIAAPVGAPAILATTAARGIASRTLEPDAMRATRQQGPLMDPQRHYTSPVPRSIRGPVPLDTTERQGLAPALPLDPGVTLRSPVPHANRRRSSPTVR